MGNGLTSVLAMARDHCTGGCKGRATTDLNKNNPLHSSQTPTAEPITGLCRAGPHVTGWESGSGSWRKVQDSHLHLKAVLHVWAGLREELQEPARTGIAAMGSAKGARCGQIPAVVWEPAQGRAEQQLKSLAGTLSTQLRETPSTSSIWASLISPRLTRVKNSLLGTEEWSQETQDGFCALKINKLLWHHPDTGIVCTAMKHAARGQGASGDREHQWVRMKENRGASCLAVLYLNLLEPTELEDAVHLLPLADRGEQRLHVLQASLP